MNLLTRDESEAWINKRCPDALSINHEVTPDELYYLLPKDGGVRVAFAQNIVNAFFKKRDCLLYVGLYDIWPSVELPFLFEDFRSLRSELATIGDKPGTLFRPDETKDLSALLALSLIFCWDVFLLAETPHVLFAFSHDEFFCARALKSSQKSRLTEFLGSWNFQSIP